MKLRRNDPVNRVCASWRICGMLNLRANEFPNANKRPGLKRGKPSLRLAEAPELPWCVMCDPGN